MGTVSWNKGILYPRTAGATWTSVGERNFVKLAIQGKSPFVTENRRSMTALYHNKRRSTAVKFLKRPSLLSIYHILRFFPLPLFSPKKRENRCRRTRPIFLPTHHETGRCPLYTHCYSCYGYALCCTHRGGVIESLILSKEP